MQLRKAEIVCVTTQSLAKQRTCSQNCLSTTFSTTVPHWLVCNQRQFKMVIKVYMTEQICTRNILAACCWI